MVNMFQSSCIGNFHFWRLSPGGQALLWPAASLSLSWSGPWVYFGLYTFFLELLVTLSLCLLSPFFHEIRYFHPFFGNSDERKKMFQEVLANLERFMVRPARARVSLKPARVSRTEAAAVRLLGRPNPYCPLLRGLEYVFCKIHI